MRQREHVNGERINLHQVSEVRDWSRRLGVTPEAVRCAAAAVGDRVERVRELLRRTAKERETSERRQG